MRIVGWLGAILDRIGRGRPRDVSDERLAELRKAADPAHVDEDYGGWRRP